MAQISPQSIDEAGRIQTGRLITGPRAYAHGLSQQSYDQFMALLRRKKKLRRALRQQIEQPTSSTQ